MVDQQHEVGAEDPLLTFLKGHPSTQHCAAELKEYLSSQCLIYHIEELKAFMNHRDAPNYEAMRKNLLEALFGEEKTALNRKYASLLATVAMDTFVNPPSRTESSRPQLTPCSQPSVSGANAGSQ